MSYATRLRQSAQRGDRRELSSLGIDPALDRLDRVTAMVRELRETFVGIQSGDKR